nr:DUF4043 family protein [Anaerolineae bacterium]
MSDYASGALYSSSLPAGQRAYYEQVLLDTLRTQSILVPFAIMKEDFRARDTGQIVYTEVFDPEPNWNSVAESTIWLTGQHLDSRTVNIGLEIHGGTIKVSDYNELVNFWASGDLRGLCRGKLGASMVTELDILMRNAILDAPAAYKHFSGDATSRYELAQSDVFDVNLGGLVRVHLEERDIPGVMSPEDGGGEVIVGITSPRVIYDIRKAEGSAWLDVQNYHQTGRPFTNEAGMWDAVRYVKTNRMRMFNHGKVIAQTTLNGATVVGQGAKQVVDQVYNVGQSTSTRYVTVTDSSVFSVGDMVTIHYEGAAVDDGDGGFAVPESDGTQETRRVVELNAGGANRISFDRPLMKEHADGDYVTRAVTIHATGFMGGPSIVYGVGERPHPMILPKFDDLGMINRFSWRGFLKFQQYRPEWIEVVESGGSNT